MKELFIDDIQYNNIEVTCKKYLTDTCKYILLLTNDGEYRISQNQSHVNKFEKIERDFISNYVTTIYDKQVYINNYKNKFIHTRCTPTIQKELFVSKNIYKLYSKTKIYFVLETIQTLSESESESHNEFTYEPNHIQKRGYFELQDNTDESNKIVENELIQWFKLMS
jgi:predicted methyltransferase